MITVTCVNAIVCHESHVFLKSMLLLIPLNIVRQNQYSFKELKIKKEKKKCCHTYFSVELYLPIRPILMYQYLKDVLLTSKKNNKNKKRNSLQFKYCFGGISIESI